MPLRSLTSHGITWYHLVHTDEDELIELQKRFGFHALDIEDCLSENERPKIEEYESYLFGVFHVPVKPGSKVIKEDINVFLGSDFIVTFSDDKSGALNQLRKNLEASEKKRDEYFDRGSGFFLYKLLDLLFDQGFPLIESLMKDLRRMEVELFENEERQKKILRSILSLKRNIITMRSILFPQRTVVAQLQHRSRALIPEDLRIYFDDVSDAIERQWSLLDTAKEMSDVLQETHESWLTHRTNEIIRLLTIFSVTMVPLTFIASFYGMNVPLPLQDNPLAFEIIGGSMGGILVIFIVYFMWKKWF